MANYKESTVAGSSYVRARLVSFSNEEGTNPYVTFIEEEVIQLADKKVKQAAGKLFEAFDAAKTFPKFDAVTGELSTTETMTHQDLFLWLHGLYLSLAYVRDNPPIPGVPAP